MRDGSDLLPMFNKEEFELLRKKMAELDDITSKALFRRKGLDISDHKPQRTLRVDLREVVRKGSRGMTSCKENL